MSFEENCRNIIYSTLTYNSRLDVQKIPANYLGFSLVIKKCNDGLLELEIKNTFLPFVIRIISRMAESLFSPCNLKYKKIIESENNIKDNLKELFNVESYIEFINNLIKLSKIDNFLSKDEVNKIFESISSS